MARIIKRIFDLLAAGIGLIVLSPLLLIVAALIRLTMGRPVLFRQIRPGYKEHPFTMFKFRTMREAYDAEGQLLPAAQRLTSLGSLLRKTSIDELPQVVNILLGTMSFVGPRPTLPYQVERYNAEQRRRLEVRPGLTGLAQINGRNSITWEEKIVWDLQYIDRFSLWLDWQIICKTVLVVFALKNTVFLKSDYLNRE